MTVTMIEVKIGVKIEVKMMTKIGCHLSIPPNNLMKKLSTAARIP